MTTFIHNVRHIGVVVPDMVGALHFYREFLGLRVVRDQVEGGEYIERLLGLDGGRVRTVKLGTEAGDCLVELLEFTPAGAARGEELSVRTPGPTHLAFTVEDLDALHRRLTAAGVEFISAPQRSPDGGASVAFCRDPVGTFVELVQLHG